MKEIEIVRWETGKCPRCGRLFDWKSNKGADQLCEPCTLAVSGLCKWLCTRCGHFVTSDKNDLVCGNCGAKAEEAAHPLYGIRGRLDD